MKFINDLYYFFGLLIIILLTSCDGELVFENNQKIKSNQWYQNEELEFNVTIDDTVNIHKFYINLRHGGNYQFSNIFMFIYTNLPDGSLFRDTVECTLAADDGRWLGNGIGDIREAKILFKKNLIFPLKGNYRFRLEQAMRIDPLQYVYDVGIRIEKSVAQDDESINRFFRFQEREPINSVKEN